MIADCIPNYLLDTLTMLVSRRFINLILLTQRNYSLWFTSLGTKRSQTALKSTWICTNF